MMNYEERIQLRDELFKEFEENEIIYKERNCIKINFIKLNNICNLKQKWDQYINEFRTQDEAIYCLMHNDDFQNHICPICNTNICIFYRHNSHNEYRKTCSKKCSIKLSYTEEAKEKRKQTTLERYNVEYIGQSKEIREKIKNTNLKVYGAESPFGSKEVRNKIKETNFNRYGAENVLQSEIIKDKRKKTMYDRYGVEYVFQIEGIQEKIKQTNKERYGVENVMQCKEIQEKAKETNREKYGVENPMQNENIKKKQNKTTEERYGTKNVMQNIEIKEKAKKTNLERYNAENPFGSKEIQEKIKQTNKERYGAENPMQSEEIQNKVKQTNLKNLGVEWPAQNSKVMEKQKQTNREKYGVECSFQNEKIQEKIKQTNKERYGVEYPFQSEEIKEKIRKTRLERYGVIDPILKEETLSLFNNQYELIDIYIHDNLFKELIVKKYKEKNRLLRLNEIGDIFDYCSQSIKKRIIELNLLDYFYIQDSELELQFKEFLKNNNYIENNDFIRHDRGTLPPTDALGHQELDFLFKEKNIAFEINDFASHNILQKDQFYHFNKTIECAKKGIHLIHIWEWELTESDIWERTSKWILNLLNDNKTQISATDCIIEEVSCDEEKEFIDKYYIKEYQKSDISIGLYHNNELIQIMSFCKIKDNNFELLSFCTKYKYYVINGVQKLLNYFIDHYNPKSIISYCDLDKFNNYNKIYEKVNFTLVDKVEPLKIWNNKIYINEYKNNYMSIYDCGKYKYILKF